MNDEKYMLIKFIYAKNNELESMKKFTQDDVLLKIIDAKQDTLTDIEEFLNNEIRQNILNNA